VILAAVYVVLLMVCLLGLRRGLIPASLCLSLNISITIDATGDNCIVCFTREMIIQALASLS